MKSFTHPHGSVVSLPRLPVTVLRGIVKPKSAPPTLEEMDEAVAAAAEAHKTRNRR